jgi:hypothetical protein
MYEVLTSQQPYFDVGMSTRELIDLIGHRTIPLVSSFAKKKTLVSQLLPSCFLKSLFLSSYPSSPSTPPPPPSLVVQKT